jgi:hypothetical protein
VNPDLQRLSDGIQTSIYGMMPAQLGFHPVGKWSAAEILEHLYLSYTATIKGFERCLQKDTPLARQPNFMDGVRTSVVLRFRYMPEGRQAPRPTVPKGLPAEQVVAEIGAKISALDDIIFRCEARFGSQRRVLDHPILGPLTTRQWCRFHWVHGKHHLKQIARLRLRQAETSL